jgi:hypothetical protein
MKGQVIPVAHRDLPRSAGAAGNREELELSLKERMSWVRHFHEVPIRRDFASLTLVFSRGINKGW